MRRDDLCEAIRQGLRRLPAPYDHHYGVMPPPPPESGVSIGEAADRYAAASAALARVNALARELADPYLVGRVLIRREAVSSSAMEGTHSTLDEILSLEETATEEMRAAARQVRDYATVLDRLIPEAQRSGPALFDLPLIQDLHRAVMQGDDGYQDRPGALRDRVVWIGGRGDIAYSTFNPPPPADVPSLLADTIAYLRQDRLTALPQGLITRMAIAHAHFEAVHPFRDGNGRVGRVLLPLMMAADGQVPLYLSPYIEAHKPAYIAALKAAQQRLDWAAIIGFMSDAVIGTVAELMDTRRALQELAADWQTRRRYRRGSAALRALAILPHHPVITVARLSSLLDVSYPQAASAVAQLQGAGILAERTGYARNRIFVATEALSILNRPFGAEIAPAP